MNLKNLFLAVLLAVAASCVKIDYVNRIPTNSNGDYAILFSNPRTKAQITSVSGTGYDSFKLFTWNSINDTIMNPYIVMASGEGAYQYEDIDGQERQYFKRVANWYDLVGIIPTTHNTTLKDGSVKIKDVTSFVVDDKRAEKAVNLTDTLYWSTGLAVESPEEFLTAYKRVEKENYNYAVELPFKHQNALIFLGFSSDQTDTKLLDYAPGTPDVPGVPAHTDTTGYYFRLKYGTLVGSSTSREGTSIIPESVINEIRSYYSIDGGNAGDYSNVTNSIGQITGNHTLKVVKDIPAAYKLSSEIPGTGKTFDFFDGYKYLQDQGYPVSAGSNGSKPACWDYVLINLYVNNNGTYSVQTFDQYYSDAKPVYETVDVPGVDPVPGKPALEGVRVFSADSLGVNNLPADTLYCVHIPHTVTADATVDASGCTLSNRATTDDVIQFSLPENTTLSATPVWSPSTFYALPGDVDFNFIVVKLSYIYKNVTTYDVRVPIHLPDGGLQPGKYYKYELYITSTSNGTNDPDEASDEKDEILIKDNPVIQVKLIESGYTQGDERQFKI